MRNDFRIFQVSLNLDCSHFMFGTETFSYVKGSTLRNVDDFEKNEKTGLSCLLSRNFYLNGSLRVMWVKMKLTLIKLAFQLYLELS